MDSVTTGVPQGDGLQSRRLETVSALAVGITHELTNTFASVNMALDLLGAGARECDRWIVSSLDASVRRGMEALRQLLWLASAKEKELLVYQAVHLIRDVQKLLREALPPTITLTSEHPEDVCLVHGEPLVLYQLLLTLSRQAAAELALGGSLILRARTTACDEIDVAQNPPARRGPYLQVDVESRQTPSLEAVSARRDEPVGPPQELLEALGRDGGFLSVRRLDARTTSVSIFLPAAPRITASVGPGVDDGGERGHGETILVVEPHATLRGVLVGVLATNGYRTVAVEEAAEGLARLAHAAEPVAMALLAARSVLHEGTGVLRAMQRLHENLPILVTGDPSALAAIPAFGPPVATLESPFTTAGLFQALDAGLARLQGAPA